MTEQQVTPLGQKIVAAILGTTFIALILTLLLSIVPAMYMYRQDVVDRTRAQAELLSVSLTASVDFSDKEAAIDSLSTLSLVQTVTGAAVYVGDDVPFASYGVAPPRVQAQQLDIHESLNQLMVVCPILAGSPESQVVIEVSLAGQWELLKNQIWISFIILLIVFSASYKLARRFRRKLGDPLEQLTEVVRETSESKDYSRRVAYDSNDEIGVLVAEFNSMLGKVEQRDIQLRNHHLVLEEKVTERTLQLRKKHLELQNNNKLLLSEIEKRTKAEMIREEVERINRHDLKSGLSLVIGYPELIINEGGLSSKQTRHIKRVRAAGYRMLDMIRNQLDIFKMEKGIYSLNTSKVDVIEVVCSLEDEFAPLLENSGVSFGLQLNGLEVVGDEVFTVTGEIALVRTMLRNLIQNGIEASSPGDKVNISLHDGHCKEIAIFSPKPVPEGIRRRFFDKYVTDGKENGTGLGTYFAALIAKTHGANISMKTDDLVGTTITIYYKEITDASAESLEATVKVL